MLRTRLSKILLGATLLWSATASAHEAWTTRQTNVRAGPDQTYPVVGVLAAGYPVEVVGCVNDYSWCDVLFANDRGWVRSHRLQSVYQSRRVPLYDYRASFGLPIVTFSLLNYWDDHYRSHSWYHDRPRWQGAPHSNWSNDRDGSYDRRDDRRDFNNRPYEPQYRDQRRDQRYESPHYYQRPRPVEPQPLYRGEQPYREGQRRIERPQAQAVLQPQFIPPQQQPSIVQRAPPPQQQAMPAPPPMPQPPARPGRLEGPRQQAEASRRPPDREPARN